MNTSKVISLSATDAKGVERELIKELDALHRTDKVWPTFTPVKYDFISSISIDFRI
jgi:hypothetical protein